MNTVCVCVFVNKAKRSLMEEKIDQLVELS